jgi:hypothetical protein
MNYDYNTGRKNLVLPEYGRNIQKMVDYTVSIEDDKERNRAARAIIAIMGNMNPHLRDVTDFKHKLWDHLAIMSDFKLTIDSPYAPPSQEKLRERPRSVPYQTNHIRYKHYGRAVEMMIQKATEMPDGVEKSVLTQLIANHMKKSYLTWNREVVTDDIIFQDIEELSNGNLIPDKSMKLPETKDILSKTKKSPPPRKQGKRKQNK